MSWALVLYGLVPLIVFVVVDMLASMKWAFVSAVVFAVCEILLVYHYSGKWDLISFAAAGLIIILGAISVKLDNSLYFKFQPVVMSVLIAGILVYFQFLGDPILSRFLPQLKELLPADISPYLENTEFVSAINLFFNWLIVMVLVHGLIIAYAALKCSDLVWLIVRGLGFWILGALLLLGEVIYLYFGR